MLNACVRDDCWHLWVGEGLRYLGNDGWMTSIAVGRPKIPLQLFHNPSELVRYYRYKIEDITL